MRNLFQDMIFGLRLMLKSPGFTAIAIITLALGIGANSAVFSVVNAILIRPLPFEDVDRVMWVWGRWPGGDRGAVSPPDFLDYRKQNTLFEKFAAFLPTVYNLTDNNNPERVEGAAVSAGFFEALGIKPTLGRVFLPEDEQEGRDRIAILNNGLWRRRYNSNPDILGKTIPVDGASFTVVGVMPENFQFPREADLYVPMPLYMKGMQNRKANMLRPIVRIKPGVSERQAQSELDSIAHALESQYPDTNRGRGLRIVPLKQEILGDIGSVLIMLLGAVGFVLLIACANVANLLLARAAARQKEIAIRTALGAKRGRIIRQLLAESVSLSLIGGVLGILLAVLGTGALAAATPANVPRVKEVNIDGLVLAFTFLISVATGLIFGLAPALHASKTNLNETLKEAAKGSTGGVRTGRIRNLLVMTEIALALMLLIGAALMIKSFTRLQSVDPGFDADNVLTMRIQLPDYKYSSMQQRANFFQQVLERAGSLPGVESVGMTSELPLAGQFNDAYFNVEGRPSQTADDRSVANFRMVSAKYFQTMSVSLLKGRLFTQQEEAQVAPVIIVNRTLARRTFPDDEPLGKRLVIDVGEPLSCEIVGVVEDVRNYGLDEDIFQEIYLPFIGGNRTNLVVKTKTPPTSLAGAVRGVVRSIDNDQPIAAVRTMEDVIATSIAEPRFRTQLLSIFAALALILAAVGIYGVMAYSVVQRSHEIGVRLALGAKASDILKMIIGHALKLALIGVIVGIAGAFALTRILSNQLYSVSSTDPISFMIVPVLLLTVAIVASIIPARRATKVNPIVVLRCE